MRIWRWIEWPVIVLVAGFVVLYAGDWAVYKLRGSPQSKVTVNRYLSVPLKGNKQEFDYQGTAEVPCAEALFSQGGQSPCWQVRRNKNQWTTI